jgi:D-hydroxyproline dehydrogenase subunit alpha
VTRSVTIVGAGPAGMAAAIEALRRGCRVTLIDDAARPGGQIYRQAHPDLAGAEHAEPAELARKRAVLERFERVIGRLDYRAGTSVFAVFPNGEVHIAEGDRTASLRSRFRAGPSRA